VDWVRFRVPVRDSRDRLELAARVGLIAARGTQTGAARGGFEIGNVGEAIGSPLALLGPCLCIFVIAAIVYAIRNKTDPARDRLLFLIWIGLGFILVAMSVSLRAKMELNWPAPGFLTLLIVAAHFISTRTDWKPWRGWMWGAIGTIIVVALILHDFVSVPAITHRGIDPLARVRGWQALARDVSLELRQLSPGAFVVCDSYQQTALMSFYVDNRPNAYCAGPYYTSEPSRLSQYDMWPDHRLDDPALIGRDAVLWERAGRFPREFPKRLRACRRCFRLISSWTA